MYAAAGESVVWRREKCGGGQSITLPPASARSTQHAARSTEELKWAAGEDGAGWRCDTRRGFGGETQAGIAAQVARRLDDEGAGAVGIGAERARTDGRGALDQPKLVDLVRRQGRQVLPQG